MARFDRQKLYDRVEDFFDLDGNAGMKLSRQAAIALCSAATRKALVVVKIEGGIWHDSQFEARLDAIWEGLDPPMSEKQASHNNMNAATFIKSAADIDNAFILTCAAGTGYDHSATETRTRLKREQVGNE
jgi:hypothetical protein